MTFGFLLLDNFNNDWLDELIEGDPSPPIVGLTRDQWHLFPWLCASTQHKQVERYYRPLGFEGQYLDWYDHLRGRPLTRQVELWVEAAGRLDVPIQAMSLQDFLDTSLNWGDRRAIVQVQNEPWKFLDRMDVMREFDDFLAAAGERVWDMGGVASLGAWSTGVTSSRLFAHLPNSLALCFAGMGYVELHEYSPIFPTVWMGDNQSHGVPVTATNEEKWDAIWQDPLPDFDDPGTHRPSWTFARWAGIGNGDGTYGIPELAGIPKLLGEGVVNHIVDDRLPKRKGGEDFEGVQTTIFAVAERLGIDPDYVPVRGLEVADDFLDRFVMGSDEGHTDLTEPKQEVPLRMAFCVGPGNFPDHQIFANQKQYNYYRQYLTR